MQVITATDTTSRSTTSNSFVTASNSLTVNITPASTSNKIYVVVSAGMHGSTTTANAVGTIYRDSTDLGSGTSGFAVTYAEGGADIGSPVSMTVLDSPSSTSQVAVSGYSGGGKNLISYFNEKGTITAFEIAG